MIAKIKRRKKSESSEAIFFSLLLGVLTLLAIAFLIYGNLKISRQRSKLAFKAESLRLEINKLEEIKKNLEEGIVRSGDKEYIEKIAREELGLQQPGEKVVAFKLPEQKPQEEKKNPWNPKTWWQWLRGKF